MLNVRVCPTFFNRSLSVFSQLLSELSKFILKSNYLIFDGSFVYDSSGQAWEAAPNHANVLSGSREHLNLNLFLIKIQIVFSKYIFSEILKANPKKKVFWCINLLISQNRYMILSNVLIHSGSEMCVMTQFFFLLVCLLKHHHHRRLKNYTNRIHQLRQGSPRLSHHHHWSPKALEKPL